MIRLALCFGLALLSCGPTSYAIDPVIASYGIELMQCVEKSETMVDYTACKAKVKAKYAPLKPHKVTAVELVDAGAAHD